jgi:hypothetical protein
MITNSTNIEKTIIKDITKILSVYNKYTNTNLNGIVLWYGDKDVVLDKFWISNYYTTNKNGKDNLIAKKLVMELL